MSEPEIFIAEIEELRSALSRARIAQEVVQQQRQRIAELEMRNRELERTQSREHISVQRTLAAPLTAGATTVQYMVELTLKE